MAYFANGTEGMKFENQCGKCKFGELSCPIAGVQSLYNYKAVNNKIATNILNDLIKNDGTCEMFKTFRNELEIDLTDEKIIAERYGQLLLEQNA